MKGATDHRAAAFPSIVSVVIFIAALYFARVVLVPISLAILLSFLLSPLVGWMEEHHLGHSGPVALVVLLAISVFAGFGWVVFDQAINLAAQVPSYQATISRKIESIRGVNQTGIAKAEVTVQELGQELSSTMQSPAAVPNPENSGRRRRSSLPAATPEHPLPVEVIPQTSPLTSLRSMAGPVLLPLATIGIVMVFTAFILLRRKDLKDRVFTLAGLNRVHVTTQAFEEATRSVGRYLLLQSLVNLCYGIMFGLALFFIGVPNALLWGVLAGVLRFIPYIGNLAGAAMPILLSMAVFDGWMRPLLALGAFVVIEFSTAYIVEPLLYASRTGISSIAILVAAIFWAALWGPIGLLLSTPLTVCIVVMGRYIPQLEFLSVLFGDKRVLAPEVLLYQSLLAMDEQGAKRVVEEFLAQASTPDLYDSILMPVLIFAEKDRYDGLLGDDRQRFLFRTLKEIIEQLTAEAIPISAGPRAAVPATPPPPALPSQIHADPVLSICCWPAREEADEIAGMMLSHLLISAGYQAHAIAPADLSEMLEEASEQDCQILCISSLPPLSVSQVRRTYKRIRARLPNIRVGIGLWGYEAETDLMRTRLGVGDSDLISTTLADIVAQVPYLSDIAAQEQ